LSRSDWRAELDADHQPLAANLLEQFIAGNHSGQRQPKLGAALGGRLDQFFGLEHLERCNAGGHREIVFRKRRAMHNGAIHLIEDLVEDVLASEQRADRNMAA